MAIPDRIHILLVEDCLDDAELLAIQLRDAGLPVDLIRIADPHGLRRHLLEATPHLIVSDANLPGFSGRQALQLSRELAPEVPFVLLSGSLDPASDSSFADAVDACLSKRDLAQMPETIRRLLK